MESSSLATPKLRASVQVELGDRSATFTNPAGSFVLRFPAQGRQAVAGLIEDLQRGGIEAETLVRQHGEIDELPALIEQLDGLHLLTDSSFAVPTGISSGAQLDRELRRMVRRQQTRLATSRFYHALCDGTATRRQLIGYALEYFWLVRAAPALIAPALATATNPETRAALQAFLVSELDHDQFLREALQAAGVTDDLRYLQPLPTTFQICASLGAYAQQHPLSFQASLFLFEQPQPAFVEAFEARCTMLGLPPGFYLPLREHSGINEDADHGTITTRLLSLVPAVSAEERVVVMRNVAVLTETMILQEDEILDYYGEGSHPLPRLFG